MKFNEENKNIFQVCIGLNDEIESLRISIKNLQTLNPSYNYNYIDTEDLMWHIMLDNFKNSEDAFDQKIYESFEAVETVLKPLTLAHITPEKKEDFYKIHILVSRIDIFRYAMLYKFGGLYCDLSSQFEVDLNKELAQYDAFFIRSNTEVHIGILYAKKNNIIMRKILERITETCTCETAPRSINIMELAGPSTCTKVISGISDLSEMNVKILNRCTDNHSISFNLQAPWKNLLHQAKPNNPDLKINAHWYLSLEDLEKYTKRWNASLFR
jgi:mannosyltransferase OCH1-like enzyme